MADLIYDEIRLFLVCLALGSLLALLYDGIRIFRMMFHHWNWVVDVEDLAYWIVTAWLVFRTLFAFNRGALRGYAFLGLFLGVVCYMLTFSKLFMWSAGKMLPFWNKGKQILKKPLISLGNILRKGLKNVVSDVKIALRSR